MKTSCFILLILLISTQTHVAFQPQKTQSDHEKLIARAVTLLVENTHDKKPIAQKITLSALPKDTQNEQCVLCNNATTPRTSPSKLPTQSPEDVIKDFYRKVFFARTPTATDTVNDLQSALQDTQTHTTLLKKHFFFSIVPDTNPDANKALIMRCEIPEKSAPGGKMVVSGQIQIKTHDNLFKILHACCSDLDMRP